MKRKFIQVAVVMAILAVLVMPSVALAESPSTFSTVAYGQNLGSFGETFQRHNFDAVGLNWVFWNNGSAIIYSTSSDTVSWSTPSIFSSFSNLDSGYSEGSSFSLWYDESANFVDIAYLNVSGTNKAIYYDRFTPVSDGTIVKGTIQVAVAGSATHNYSTPSICVNQNDLPFIAYMSENASTSELKAYVATSKVGAGVWTSATNSTISVSNTLVNNSLQESSYKKTRSLRRRECLP